jgi:hypothetical protein
VSNVRVNMGRMKYGYARTSTDDQTTALSAEQIEHALERREGSVLLWFFSPIPNIMDDPDDSDYDYKRTQAI